MSPAGAVNNELDLRSGYIKFFGYFSLRFNCRIFRSYLKDLCLSKFGSAAIFSFRSMSSNGPSFFSHIFTVLFGCSKPQVGWINTWRIITSVANEKTVRNFSIVYFPRNSMSSFVFKVSIPVLRRSDPYPAIVSFINLIPELLHGGGFNKKGWVLQ